MKPARFTPLFAAAALCLAGSAQAALMGHWEFEEGTLATTTGDSVSSTTSATFPAGTSIAAGGSEGSAFSHANTGALFSFVDTEVTGASLGLTGSGAKTLIAWVNSGTSGAWDGGARHGVISYSPDSGTGSGGDLRLLIDEDDGVRFEVSGGFAATNNTSLDDGEWHMVAVVIEAGDGVHDIQFYIDGSFASIDSQSGGNPTINTSSSIPGGVEGNLDLVIGGDQRTDNPSGGTDATAGINAFLGNIDNVRIYNTALNETELDAIYAIPEPASLVLLGLGGLCMLGRSRRA